MNLRYHNLEINGSQECVSLLSLEPQYRTTYVYPGISPVRFAWPHLFFLFKYTKIDDNTFMYPGLYGSGLHVLLRSEPLTSFDDNVGFSPTEHHASRMACTDHKWDKSVFPTPLMLFGTILEIWWGSPHHFPSNAAVSIEIWRNMSLEESLKHCWKESRTMRSFIGRVDRDELMDKPVGILPSSYKKGAKLYGH